MSDASAKIAEQIEGVRQEIAGLDQEIDRAKEMLDHDPWKWSGVISVAKAKRVDLACKLRQLSQTFPLDDTQSRQRAGQVWIR